MLRTTSRSDARELPGIVVHLWEAHLSFANSSAFLTQVRRVAAERHATSAVVQCEVMTDVDVSAAWMFEQLDRELNAAGVRMAFAEMRGRLRDLVRRYGLYETLDRDCFYPALEAAVTAVREEDSWATTMEQSLRLASLWPTDRTRPKSGRWTRPA